MYQLCVKLPPFSPDYSGVCSALFQLGGLIVIHDASGCTGNYTGYDEPRFYGSRTQVYCSGLRELDAVMGNDEKFVQRIQLAAADLKPNFICFLGSPVPMVIGTDLVGIAKEIEQATKLPTFGFATTGLHFYNKGLSDAWAALARRFLQPGKNQSTIARGVNLLGLSPLDLSANRNGLELIQTVSQMGFEVVCDFAMYSDFERIQQAAAAQVNLVVTESGLELAEYFYQTLGIPYVVGAPICDSCERQLTMLLQAAIADGENRILETDDQAEKQILIIHEEVLANALKTCLIEEYDQSGISVASCFSRKRIGYQEQTQITAHEKDLKALMNQGDYRIIIGDPLFKELLDDPQVLFVDLPHVAVSSKLYWDDYIEFSKKGLQTLIETHILGCASNTR